MDLFAGVITLSTPKISENVYYLFFSLHYRRYSRDISNARKNLMENVRRRMVDSVSCNRMGFITRQKIIRVSIANMSDVYFARGLRYSSE